MRDIRRFGALAAILSAAEYAVWLDRANNPANDTPECVEPFPGQRLTTT